MRLLDFFSRRTRPPDTDRDTVPRCDHYSFTHRVLRDEAFLNPVPCVTGLASPQSQRQISDLWNTVRAICREHGEPVTLDPEDILIHQVPVGPWPCTVIEMPAAARKTEAFFVALILKVDLKHCQSGFETDAGFQMEPLRYLTLEFSATNSIDEVQTVIGEWTRDGSHVLLGSGPEPVLPAFVTRVEEIVTSRKLD